MISVLNIILIVSTSIIVIPMIVFFMECILAILPWRKPSSNKKELQRPGIAVLIPAHCEELVLDRTLKTLLNTVHDDDRVVVVADNCTDETADIAQRRGVITLKRTNDKLRGKGYALAHGIEYLKQDPPDVVVVIDADCQVSSHAVETIAKESFESRRPVQALNLCDHDLQENSTQVISDLSLRFRNYIRPLGLARVGVGCHLMGNGMAFPWNVICDADLGGANLVEDMQLGIDLAINNHSTQFCPQARVSSALPQQHQAFMSQRRRWEHGHLQTTFIQVPRMLFAAIRQRRVSLFFQALDLSVPPLSLLVVIWLVGVFLTTGAWLFGLSSVPILLLAFSGSAMGSAILAGWWGYCREQIPLSVLLRVPSYIIKKVPIYTAFLAGRQQEWTRTQRDPDLA